MRPLPVIALALLVTAAVTYKFAMKKRMYTADVVLAMSEGALGKDRDLSIPFDQLKEYVANVLLPDGEVLKIIERRMPGRVERVGKPFALETFRDKLEIFIWKNSFAYFDDDDAEARKSARIGLELSDEDPDVAYDIALDLAQVAIATHDAERKKVSGQLASEIQEMRDQNAVRLEEIDGELAAKQNALDTAKRAGNNDKAATMVVDIANLTQAKKKVSETLKQIDMSPDAFADRITEAKLDITISVVDQVRPERVEQSGMILAMIIAVIGTGSLLGAALVLGAFDPRVHETDDVTRLGLPVLGHVPNFQGDHVGSLDARGAARARVPSFLRWRSQR
ncbi:MAG: hypothetical protein H0V17_11985 [Deltaproteobacteria bacterium]|nr:hypothetical protein [Deltaproteobacteria bacterium]